MRCILQYLNNAPIIKDRIPEGGDSMDATSLITALLFPIFRKLIQSLRKLLHHLPHLGKLPLNLNDPVIHGAAVVFDRLFLGKALLARQDVSINNKHCSQPYTAHGPQEEKIVREDGPDVRVSGTIVLQAADHEEVQDGKKEHGFTYEDKETAYPGGHFALARDYFVKHRQHFKHFFLLQVE